MVYYKQNIVKKCLTNEEMKMSNVIKKIRIKNFRSIVDETIDCDSLNIFVGKNDVGKSNILKALDLFFHYDKNTFVFYDNFSLFHKTSIKKAKEILIEITIEIPNAFSEHGEVVWKKVWREEGLVKDEKNKTFKAYSRANSFLSRINYEYIPAVKSRQYFQDLLSKLYRALLNSADSKIKSANDSYSSILKKITEKLSRNIKSSLGIDSYLKMPANLDKLFKDLLFQTANEKGEVPLQFRGDGLQARHIPEILKFIADKAINDIPKRSVRGAVIWGFEEPENGVELSACYEVAQQLLGYSDTIQLFLTTHSPAIYSLKNEKNTLLYYVTARNGVSKYDKEITTEHIDGEMGLMPIVEPYIKQKMEELVYERTERGKIQEELNRIKKEIDRIIIFTEGKTDVEYLKLAFSRFTSYKQLEERILYYDIEKAKETGDGELKKIFDYLQKGNDANIKICMFDRDSSGYIIKDEFEEGANNVYRFNIPVPTHRNIDDKISIEHYLTDDNFNTLDSNGRKMFLAKDFNAKGISLDEKFVWDHATKPSSKDYNPLGIVNGSGDKKVFSVRSENMMNYALSKKEFVDKIKNKEEGFDFDLKEFEAILKVIEKIVAYADAKRN